MPQNLANRVRLQLWAGLALAACSMAAIWIAGCQPTGASLPENSPPAAPVDAAGVAFQDLATERGLIYRWPDQPRPMRQPEAFGHGCVFFDYDQDGWQDVLLTAVPHCKLFQNRGGGWFQDVTEAAGLTQVSGSWTGATPGDYNADGFLDLVLMGYHQMAVLEGTGDGFREVTAAAGFDPGNRGHWGSSAGFMDLDGDQLLDLVLLNYVIFGPDEVQYCELAPGVLSGCAPSTYRPEFGEVWRNLGDGTLEMVPHENGMQETNGKGLVLAFADLDEDGRQDFYIGNDGMYAELLHNQGDMQFRNMNHASGLAMNGFEVLAAMGADWGDYDRDGQFDLIVTGFSDQPYAVFHNLGDLTFEGAGDALGIALPTTTPLGFGAKWIELDNDGWLDICFVNGHVYDNVAAIFKEQSYRQPLMLFHNRQGREFVDLVPVLGGDAARPMVGRGSANADFDNDGRMDMLVVDHEGPPLLLHNQSRTPHHWLRLELRTAGTNRYAYGARVTARAGSAQWIAQVSPASSYLSASDPRIHLGLGGAAQLDSLVIRWPDGQEETFDDVPGDQALVILQGAGIVRQESAAAALVAPALRGKTHDAHSAGR